MSMGELFLEEIMTESHQKPWNRSVKGSFWKDWKGFVTPSQQSEICIRSTGSFFLSWFSQVEEARKLDKRQKEVLFIGLHYAKRLVTHSIPTTSSVPTSSSTFSVNRHFQIPSMISPGPYSSGRQPFSSPLCNFFVNFYFVSDNLRHKLSPIMRSDSVLIRRGNKQYSECCACVSRSNPIWVLISLIASQTLDTFNGKRY